MCCQVDSQLQATTDSFSKTLTFTSKPQWEVADIFCAFGEEYRQTHKLPLSQLKVMQAIEVCRTAYLGGHIEECENCGYRRNAYNSCRNRHCPKCQQLRKTQWLEDRKAELLPVDYFHVVFTLPHELNPLILQNKSLLLNILFRAVSETLLEFGCNNLGGKIGFTTILHTWDQTLLDHFHLHCLIPGGALSFDEKRWIYTPKNFLFPVKALSHVLSAMKNFVRRKQPGVFSSLRVNHNALYIIADKTLYVRRKNHHKAGKLPGTITDEHLPALAPIALGLFAFRCLKAQVNFALPLGKAGQVIVEDRLTALVSHPAQLLQNAHPA
jgi:predicted Zn-ribbon and HTH transcriptional regulator